MTSPGSIGNAVDALGSEDWLVRQVQDLQRQLNELKAASSLGGASIDAGDLQVNNGGSVIVNGGGDIQSGDFDGALPATPGTTGWALGGSGSNAIFNNLVLRGGIIGNSALTSPVFPRSVHADSASFSLSTTMTAKVTATVSVPAGYTQALVIAASQVTARNSTNVADILAVGVSIGGSPVPGTPADINSMATSTSHPIVCATCVGTALLTSLGSSFTITADAQSGLAAWGVDVYNQANIDAIVLFLR